MASCPPPMPPQPERTRRVVSLRAAATGQPVMRSRCARLEPSTLFARVAEHAVHVRVDPLAATQGRADRARLRAGQVQCHLARSPAEQQVTLGGDPNRTVRGARIVAAAETRQRREQLTRATSVRPSDRPAAAPRRSPRVAIAGWRGHGQEGELAEIDAAQAGGQVIARAGRAASERLLVAGGQDGAEVVVAPGARRRTPRRPGCAGRSRTAPSSPTRGSACGAGAGSGPRAPDRRRAAASPRWSRRPRSRARAPLQAVPGRAVDRVAGQRVRQQRHVRARPRWPRARNPFW